MLPPKRSTANSTRPTPPNHKPPFTNCLSPFLRPTSAAIAPAATTNSAVIHSGTRPAFVLSISLANSNAGSAALISIASQPAVLPALVLACGSGSVASTTARFKNGSFSSREISGTNSKKNPISATKLNSSLNIQTWLSAARFQFVCEGAVTPSNAWV
ncbi:hypothetical protein SDC9_112103 [bioreactor metagenome]|uniref:Uncharacterized protein n=1 Tax=bioreactor metagenome TaxID=1076179 RepID=A0A645BIB6_9ZZZZ